MRSACLFYFTQQAKRCNCLNVSFSFSGLQNIKHGTCHRASSKKKSKSKKKKRAYTYTHKPFPQSATAFRLHSLFFSLFNSPFISSMFSKKKQMKLRPITSVCVCVCVSGRSKRTSLPHRCRHRFAELMQLSNKQTKTNKQTNKKGEEYYQITVPKREHYLKKKKEHNNYNKLVLVVLLAVWPHTHTYTHKKKRRVGSTRGNRQRFLAGAYATNRENSVCKNTDTHTHTHLIKTQARTCTLMHFLSFYSRLSATEKVPLRYTTHHLLLPAGPCCCCCFPPSTSTTHPTPPSVYYFWACDDSASSRFCTASYSPSSRQSSAKQPTISPSGTGGFNSSLSASADMTS